MAYILRRKGKEKVSYREQARRQGFKTIVKSFDIDLYLILKFIEDSKIF